MRALLVNPRAHDAYWSQKEALLFTGRRSLLPPLGLITVAALLPRSWDLSLVDLNVGALADDQIRAADIVLVTGALVQQRAFLGLPASSPRTQAALDYLAWNWSASSGGTTSSASTINTQSL